MKTPWLVANSANQDYKKMEDDKPHVIFKEEKAQT